MAVAGAARFAIGDALSVGWRRFMENFAPMAIYALVVWAVSALISFPTADNPGTPLAGLYNLISWVVAQLAALGWIRLALDVIDRRPVTQDRVVTSFSRLLPYLVAAVVFSIGVAVGLVLLIVPGIIVAVTFCFYGWIIVDDERVSAVAALRRSAEITRGERLHLFGFGLVLVLVNIVGLLVLVVGVLVSSAVSLLAIGHVYRQLASAASAGHAAPRVS